MKESFRYHTYLDNAISSLLQYIRTDGNLFTVTETHQKSKVNQDAQDETIDVTTERKFDCKPEDIAHLVKDLISEKLNLSLAIENGKKYRSIGFNKDGNELSLDSAVELNKQSRSLINNLKYLVDLKSSESKRSGRDFRFNVSGDQISYQYDVEVKRVIDFDRNVIKDLYKKLVAETDMISTKIDEFMLNPHAVTFEPKYTVHDSVEDVVEKYLASR